jgi:two-component system, NarL family, sensor histidine kinase UhpB
MMQAEWLPVLMQGSFSEIYIIDASDLHFIQVNQAACANLQYTENELLRKTPLDIATALGRDLLDRTLQLLRARDSSHATLETVHVRKDGSRYPIEFRLLACPTATPPAFVAIGNDTSSHYATTEALQISESRFRAIASNTPGLVYQFLLHIDGSSEFTYLSEGCHALLGIHADALRADSSRFTDLILPEDRPSYLESMRMSAAELRSWNWEGRIWIEAWKDIKWINLRSAPGAVSSHAVQWDGIMTNITQSKLEEAEIKRSRAQLAELSAHIQTLKEQERTRIAREIHDDLGGNLTAIKMALALLSRRLPAGETVLAEKADYVDALVDRTIEAVHRISGDLRPSVLDAGLVAAIDWQAQEFVRQAGIPCDFVSSHKDIALHLDTATALFSIFQEALTNIAKHARASHVSVRLVRSPRKLRLEIRDDGCGITPADRLKSKSFGIRGMMERAMALGGDLSIGAGPEGGSLVTIEIPLA